MLSALLGRLYIVPACSLGSLTEGLDPLTIEPWSLEANYCACVRVRDGGWMEKRERASRSGGGGRRGGRKREREGEEETPPLRCVWSTKLINVSCGRAADMCACADNDDNAPGSPMAAFNRHGSEYNVLVRARCRGCWRV